MSATKRSADSGFAEHPAKRLRPQHQSHRRPAPVSALRPAQTSSNREVIYISSSSPVAIEDPPPLHQERPSGGIKPVDTFQDFAINSVEVPATGPIKRSGLEHYRNFVRHHARYYKCISVDFKSYRHTAPPNAPPGHALPDIEPPNLDLGPQNPEIDYTKHPRQNTEYAQPIYKSYTYNPLVALAVIRLAQKNLPFVDFSSDLHHLPNVGPGTFPPQFPHMEDERMPFLDKTVMWRVLENYQVIRVVFLPRYFTDGRHALAFYTRKEPSRRLCSLVCAPCTTAEIRLAGLLDILPFARDLPSSDIDNDVIGEDYALLHWNDVEIGGTGGEWLYPTLEEDKGKWEDSEDVVGWEWMVRMKLTLRQIDEDCAEADQRDGGLWGETRWE